MSSEIENLAHTLIDIKSVNIVLKNLIEKVNEIQPRIEKRISMLEERVDKLANNNAICFRDDCPRRDVHHSDDGAWM